MVKLGEIFKLSSGKSLPEKNRINGDYNVYGGNGITGNHNVYFVDKSTIVIGRVGEYCGAVHLTTDKCWVTDNALMVTNWFKDIDKQYMVYLLNAKDLHQYAKTVGQPSISQGNVYDIEVEIPPLDTQRQIAANLDKVTHTIDLCNAILEKLDLLVKARFVEMFGDFKTNTKGWKVAKFTDIAIIDGNMTTDFEKYADYPHIGIDSIEKDTGDLKGYRTVAEDSVVSGKYLFTPQHIIYSKIRPNLNKVALPDFYGVCSADAYPILPDSEKCNRLFLAYVMRSSYFLDYILQFCNRTNLPKVNRKEVSGFSTPLPPLALQEQFAAFVEQTDKSKFIAINIKKIIRRVRLNDQF